MDSVVYDATALSFGLQASNALGAQSNFHNNMTWSALLEAPALPYVASALALSTPVSAHMP
jgi:hypothetical protein